MNPDVEQRLTELEIKASFAQDMLDQLDQVIVRQQAQIDRLIVEIARLQQSPPPDGAGALRNPGDDLPPHY